MSDILERQLKEYYGLWNQTNALYTRWAKDHGMTCDALFVLYAIYSGVVHAQADGEQHFKEL